MSEFIERILREYLERSGELPRELPIDVTFERDPDGSRLIAYIPIPASLLKNMWVEKEP